MSKTICNSVDFVFVHEILVMTSGQVTLKKGLSWRPIEKIKEKPVYRMEVIQNSPGSIKEETLTVVTSFDSMPILKEYSRYPVVLRLKTDDSVFFMGSDRFPAVAEITSDRINDTYSFSSKSIP